MSIHTRMQPRSDREKDLLKYGRRQGREQEHQRIDALLESLKPLTPQDKSLIPFIDRLRELIKGENK